MHRSWPACIVLATCLAAGTARAQEEFGCRDWRSNPRSAVDGCTRLLTFLETTGSGHWVYKEKGYAYAYFGRAEARAALGDTDLAIADYTESIRNDPTAAAYNNRGNLRVRASDLAAAESDFREAVRLDPGSDVARRNLDGVLAARRRTQPAPADAAMREQGHNLDRCLTGGDFDDILAACDLVLYGSAPLTDSQRADAYASRGRVQLYRHHYGDAADDLSQAVRLRPDEPGYRTLLDQAMAGDAAAGAPAAGQPSQPDLVRRAQAALARLGYAPGVADGKAGSRTMAAVRAYQQHSGLPVDGIVTARLVTRLEAQSP
ncbi:MAG TPA: peptidoglycan-binding protein [Geminicoccaceae bacterium]|nr:peptidoglycan-binding protein [Geminicoccus sp.]HMU48635.1 peptidoglycan-binding protein [Geminicoccaceae bacterium]